MRLEQVLYQLQAILFLLQLFLMLQLLVPQPQEMGKQQLHSLQDQVTDIHRSCTTPFLQILADLWSMEELLQSW
jgi:hypothetical protein